MKKEANPVQEKPLVEKIVVLAVVLIPLAGTLYAIVRLWQHYVNALDLSLLAILYILSAGLYPFEWLPYL